MDVVSIASTSTAQAAATAQARGAGTAKACAGEKSRAQTGRSEGLFGPMDQTRIAEMAGSCD